MPYSYWTFAQLKTELANRLNDASQTYWVNAELGLYIQDAMRFWNCLCADNKQIFPLSVSSPNVYYDLQTLNQIPGSPRLCTLTDQNIYLRVMYQLLEGSSLTAVPITKQFTQDDIISSVQRKRDEFIFRTGCTSTVEEFSVAPNSPTIQLPQTVIQTRRAYWLPQPIVGQPSTAFPVLKNDEWATAAYGASFANSPGTPILGFSAGMEPPLTIDLTPPPSIPGTLECLTIESQAVLSASQATTLLIPSDFAPALMWGALADLYAMTQQKQDIQRSGYARQRFEEYISLMGEYPFVFSARVNGLPVFVDAVETLDLYASNWRTVSAQPNIVGLSGQNLVAFPTSQAATITLFLCANANVPTSDGATIQLGDEVIDAILDEAQSIASQKMGGAEAATAGALHQNIIALAGKRRAKIAAMSIFSNPMYGRVNREDAFAPKELVQN
jgi:hypothetical protein